MPAKEAEDKVTSAPEKISRESFVWGLALFFTLILMTTGATYFILSEKNLYYPLRLSYTLEYIRYLYPEDYDANRLIDLAREAVIDKLDRYSGYLEPREMDRVDEEFSGVYGGIGITIIGHERGLMIMSVREDGPASRKGLRTGDIIIRADTVDLAGINPYRATYLLRGPAGSKLGLTIARQHLEDTLTFDLVRETLPLIHIPYAGLTRNNSVYIRIIDFEAGLTHDLAAVLDSLYEPNRDSVGGIILDLRGNPGGLLEEAYRSADLFLDGGHLIVGIKGRSRWFNVAYHSSGSDRTNNTPIIVVVDDGSASAAEILAGALKYADRAVLVGDTTFGKGLVQEYSGHTDGSGLRLTTSRYYFEGGIFLNDPEAEVIDSAGGIPPDYFLRDIETEAFPLALENSGLLREFASGYRDELAAYAPLSAGSAEWFSRFMSFADEKGFAYISKTTELALLVREIASMGNNTPPTTSQAEKIFELAVNNDRDQFDRYRDYISQRLFQISLELKYGTARSYREAILPYRADIRFAEKYFNNDLESESN